MNYTYVNSQIKVIEEGILKEDDFLKLASSPKETFLKTLVDLGYGNYADSLEEIIHNELASVKAYFDEVSPKKEHTDLFFLVNDLVNIKYYYKVKVFNLFDRNIFLENGVFTKDQLKSAILENDYSTLSKEYEKLFKKIEDNVKDITDPRELSGIIDATLYEFVLDKIRFSFNAPLSTYFKTSIDFKNILSYVRIKNLNWDYLKNKSMFIEGGNISLSKIEELFTLDEKEVVRSLNEFYEEKLSLILKTYFDTNDLNLLEIQLNNLLLNIMSEFKNDAFGIGIILYYYLKKLAEASNIRYVFANSDIDEKHLLQY